MKVKGGENNSIHLIKVFYLTCRLSASNLEVYQSQATPGGMSLLVEIK